MARECSIVVLGHYFVDVAADVLELLSIGWPRDQLTRYQPRLLLASTYHFVHHVVNLVEKLAKLLVVLPRICWHFHRLKLKEVLDDEFVDGTGLTFAFSFLLQHFLDAQATILSLHCYGSLEFRTRCLCAFSIYF